MTGSKLDERVVLQMPSHENNFGEHMLTYANVATVWAEVLTQKGREAFEAARINAEETIRVRIRYREDVQTEWRAIWQNNEYHIEHVDRSARRDGFIWFTAKRKG